MMYLIIQFAEAKKNSLQLEYIFMGNGNWVAFLVRGPEREILEDKDKVFLGKGSWMNLKGW